MNSLTRIISATSVLTLAAIGTAQSDRNQPTTQEQADVRAAANRQIRAADSEREPQAAARFDPTSGVYIASIDVQHLGLGRVAGQNLWNHEGARLGEIKDFILDPASSRIRYAVVSSGGFLGMGNRLRLVPIDVMQRSQDGRGYTVHMLQAEWLEIPAISDALYVRDQLGITAEQHQTLLQRFERADDSGGAGRRQPATAPATDLAGGDTGLIRASVLRGKNVHIEGVLLGEIDEIILDLESGTAAALLDSAGEFTGTEANYLVPISRLVFESTAQNPITARLTRVEFDQARPSEPILTPTGR